jgi:acetyl/propionyl-CoA carboxylase alpha subunit
MPGIRVDAGVAQGGRVTVHYDPMIAKVIATAETRELAIARLIAALRAYPILGIRTNISFLLRVLDHPRFRAGEIDTGFLDGEGASLAGAPDTEMPPFVSAALEAARLSAVDARKTPVDKEPSGGQARDTDATTTWDPWARLREWRP